MDIQLLDHLIIVPEGVYYVWVMMELFNPDLIIYAILSGLEHF
jgi:hypothetical protein